MAYEYKYNFVEGGYVELNVSPGSNLSYGVGDTITITGRVKSSYMAIKSIEVNFTRSFQEAGKTVYPSFRWYINKSISKGTLASFTTSHTITQSDIELMKPSLWSGDTEYFYTYINIYDKTNGIDGDWTKIDTGSGYFETTFIRIRHEPTISSSFSLYDLHSVISEDKTPLQYFGNYIQNYSFPRIAASFATDPNDTKLTASHNLIVKDGQDVIVFDVSGASEVGATSLSLNLPAFPSSGTFNFTWTITDSAGLSASSSGTFVVLPYTKPLISSFILERYRTVIGEGKIAADDGENLWTTLEATVSSVSNKNAWNLDLVYGELGSSNTSTVHVTDGNDGTDIEYSRNDEVFTANVSAGSTFVFVVILSDMLDTTQETYVVLKAGGYLNVEKTGVAVGMRSTSAALNKKFEVAEDYTSHMYGGIAGVNNYPTVASGTLASEEELTGGHWVDGKPLYRRIYHITSVNSSNAADVDISDLDYDFIKWEGYFNITYNTDTTEQWLDTYNWSGNNDKARVYIYGTTLRLRLGGYLHLSSKGAWIILEYTKNTIT